MDINRKTVYHTLMDIENNNAYSNLALNHHIAVSKPGSPAFVREMVYGVLENKLLLDYYIDHLAEQGTRSLRPSELTILRMGIYQLEFMHKVPEYAAVNESVALAKKYCRGRKDLVNAVLRSYIRDKYAVRLPDRTEDEVKYLSVRYSYAPWIIELWLEQYDVEFVEELLEAGNRTPRFTIRMNWLKTVKKDLMERLKEKGYDVREGLICQNAIIVEGTDVLDNKIYEQGYFSVQDEASMLMSEKLNPQKGELIMDVCAAPGGKSLAIAERMDNKGTVVASDIYKRKLAIIDKEAERLGIYNIKTRTWDATRTDSAYIGKADRVLVDAPCSGLGVIRRKPEIKYRDCDKGLRSLPITQLAILETSSDYVKTGGTLLYCTCTINRYENDRIVNDFLRKHKDFVEKERKQLLPNVEGTDGFFYSLMERKSRVGNI